jgi:hypothetical protein
VTEANAWYLRSLTAVAHLFAGEEADAIAVAHEALSKAPRREDAPVLAAAARGKIAEILAWAGADDEAVTLLAELATSTPGLLPAQIARDPIFAAPLGQNADYQRLANRLEAEMAELKFDEDACQR